MRKKEGGFPVMQALTSTVCPSCGGSSMCNGHSEKYGVDIQRYKCQLCGERFSDKDDLARAKQAKQAYLLGISRNLKGSTDNSVNYQVCVLKEGTKNLKSETTQENVSEMQKQNGTGIDLLIADYKHYIQKETHSKRLNPQQIHLPTQTLSH